MKPRDDNFEIQYHPGALFCNEPILQECAEIYSQHYGKWGKRSKNPGTRVTLSVSRLKDWLKNDSSAIYLARHKEELVGYAIAVRKKNGCGTVSWITQLVVHSDYRNRTVAKQLLQYIWGFSQDYACGIVSANPYAVRALERTTHRKCVPVRIKKDKDKILKIGKDYVPYINEHSELCLNANESLINTNFPIDHSDVPEMLKNVISKSGWYLGDIRDGWEWLAFTFRDQPTLEYSKQDIEWILCNSDKFVKDAYSRMDLTSENQRWMGHTSDEVDFIIKECCLQQGDTVLDLGCGTGRHSFELAKHGLNVVAVDYLDNHFNAYQNKTGRKERCVSFVCDDCRDLTELSQLPQQKFKTIVCLYDVIGSYTDNEDNLKILRQIYDRLEANGTAIISVMNYDAVADCDVKDFSFKELISLNASRIMESTGNVFDAAYLLADKTEGIFYRKETFERGEHNPPVELIVRDKRFRRDEIVQMCENAGLDVEFVRCVRAGEWEDIPLINNSSSKEILLKCRKVL